MNTPLITVLALGVLTVLGGIVVLLDHLSVGTQRFTISVRDLPNTATDISADTSAVAVDAGEVVTSPGARS